MADERATRCYWCAAQIVLTDGVWERPVRRVVSERRLCFIDPITGADMGHAPARAGQFGGCSRG